VGFNEFLGNKAAVERLRRMIAAGKLPHALIFAGARGSGKYTLALMIARTLNCKVQPVTDGLPDFCGVCESCVRIAEAADLDARIAESLEVREGLRETDKRETRILIQTDPDVLIVPPDPPQMMIKIGQVRSVITSSHRFPEAGHKRVYIFTAANFMKEAANSLLKVLEEPSEFAQFILLAEHPGELMPTIRSRAAMVRLEPANFNEVMAAVQKAHPEWRATQQTLAAKLASGAIGYARSFDMEAYTAARADAILLLRSTLENDDHSALFKMTDAYRAGADGHAKSLALLRAAYLVLEDMLYIADGAPQLVRNVDIQQELARLAGVASFAWIEQAVAGLNAVESGMRRNLLRSLSLDAFAARLENTAVR
jgi:DNA polymerase-3 subunit delta'